MTRRETFNEIGWHSTCCSQFGMLCHDLAQAMCAWLNQALREFGGKIQLEHSPVASNSTIQVPQVKFDTRTNRRIMQPATLGNQMQRQSKFEDSKGPQFRKTLCQVPGERLWKAVKGCERVCSARCLGHLGHLGHARVSLGGAGTGIACVGFTGLAQWSLWLQQRGRSSGGRATKTGASQQESLFPSSRQSPFFWSYSVIWAFAIFCILFIEHLQYFCIFLLWFCPRSDSVWDSGPKLFPSPHHI